MSPTKSNQQSLCCLVSLHKYQIAKKLFTNNLQEGSTFTLKFRVIQGGSTFPLRVIGRVL